MIDDDNSICETNQEIQFRQYVDNGFCTSSTRNFVAIKNVTRLFKKNHLKTKNAHPDYCH